MSDNFIHFPPRAQIADQLADVGSSAEWCESFRRKLARRLDAKVFDAAAFTFVITELLYESCGEMEDEQPVVLAEAILALTRDRHLAINALQTYDEIFHLLA